MYKLLLVDDEKSILDGLYYNIDWNKLEISEVFRAADVPSALKILNEFRIDVLITDIRMPGKDGLTLCESIQQSHPNTKIIILSGYKDFEYAKKAIDVKVFRYVLKPVEYEALEAIVSEALVLIKQDLQKSFIVEEAKKKIDQLRPFMQARFLNLWLEKGTENILENSDELTATGLDIAKNDYAFLATITIDNWSDKPVNTNVVSLAIDDLTMQLLGEYRSISYRSMNSIIDSYNILFLDDNFTNLNSFFRKALEQFEFLQLSINESLGCTASIFWSFPMAIAEIPSTYKAISNRIKRRIGSVFGGVLGPETVNSQQTHEIKSLQLSPSLSSLMSTFQREKLLSRVAEIFTELKAPEYQTKDCLLQAYHAIIGTLISDSLQRNISLEQWGSEFTEFLENSNSISSIDGFENQAYNAINKYMDYLLTTELSQNRKIIDKIKHMIEEQISSEISVSSLSKAFNYNANYLSRIFKSETGIALQDYIIQVRIEKAKTLLLQGERVSDVSIKVGYENFPHFSRIFKKVVGVSPKQYQTK